MKPKKIISVLLLMLVAAVIVSACSGGATRPSGSNETPGTTENNAETPKFDKKYRITTAAIEINEGADFESDKMLKYFNEKFNVEHELIPIARNQRKEVVNLWVSAGDLPDMCWFDMVYVDYKNFSEQGLIKALPDDLEERFPNLAKVLEKSGVGKEFRSRDPEGKLYAIPKVIYFDAPTEKVIAHTSVYYRKDWADKVGIKMDKLASTEEVAQLARAFIQQDPGGNGPGKTIGIAADNTRLTQMLVEPFNPCVTDFFRYEGKYIWGPAAPGTLDGLKVWQNFYREGLLHPDFYVMKKNDPVDLFVSGKAGILMHDGDGKVIQAVLHDFKAQHPDLDATEAIGMFAMKGPDGKHHVMESVNYWCGVIFNPNIEDDKLDRILHIMDYVATEEAQNIIRLGFEGIDWKREGDTIVSLRPKDESGNMILLKETYPSQPYWGFLVLTGDDFSLRDPNIPKAARDMAIETFKAKEKDGNIVPLDFDLRFFSGPNYNKKGTLGVVYDELAGLVLKEGDIETTWKEWLESKADIINAITEELNGALLNK